MTRERPILFSAPMVRALLAGKKTQTRRLYKPRYPSPYEIVDETPAGEAWPFRSDEYGEYHFQASPYGVVGDRLWVRETWTTSGNHESALAASGRDSHAGPCFIFAADREKPGKGWRPSIFMPRGASRLTLEVSGVRFQRLQDISLADCEAEGVGNRESYIALWETLNSKRAPWSSNPWVWAVTFKLPGGPLTPIGSDR